MADLSIYNRIANIKPFEFNMPKLPTPFEQFEDEQKIKDIANKNKLESIISKKYANSDNPTYREMANSGLGAEIPEMELKQIKQEKEKMEYILTKGDFVASRMQQFVGKESSPEVNAQYQQMLADTERELGTQLQAPRTYDKNGVMAAYQMGTKKLQDTAKNYQLFSTTQGFKLLNKSTQQVQDLTDAQGNQLLAPNVDPESIRRMQLARESAKGISVETPEGQLRTTQGLANPQAFTDTAMDVIDRGITPVESGGTRNPATATNPNSSAYGATQVTDATQRDSGFQMPPFPKGGSAQEQKAWSATLYNHYLREFNGDQNKATQAWHDGFNAVKQGRPDQTGYTQKVNAAMGRQPIMGQSFADKERIKADIQTQEKQKSLSLATDEAQRKADIEMLRKDPERKATYETMQSNSESYKKNLEALDKQVGNNPLLNNNLVYNARAAIGADTNIANIEAQTQNFVQDQIKSMQSMGLSPTQMMNTETEAKRFMQSVAGNGNSKAKIEAFNRYEAAKKADLAAYEEQRKEAMKRQGLEYKPLIERRAANNSGAVKFLGFE